MATFTIATAHVNFPVVKSHVPRLAYPGFYLDVSNGSSSDGHSRNEQPGPAKRHLHQDTSSTVPGKISYQQHLRWCTSRPSGTPMFVCPLVQIENLLHYHQHYVNSHQQVVFVFGLLIHVRYSRLGHDGNVVSKASSISCVHKCKSARLSSVRSKVASTSIISSYHIA